MAAPNIVNVISITGKTTYLTPANTTANVLLANSASSNKVFKINMITVANVDGTASADATISINTVSDGSGTSYPIISTVTIPPDATVIAIDKSTSFYLEENRSIVVTASSASDLTFVVSYEEIS